MFTGDVLDIDVHRSWEFTSDTPVRSMVLPFIIYAPPLYVLKVVSQLGYLSAVSYLQSYLLLVLPRLSVVLLSVGVDVMMFALARRLLLNANTVMLVYTTSYVSLVFYTRTLSNAIEAFLFVALLYVTMTTTPITRYPSPKKDRLNLSRRSIHEDSDDMKTSGSDVGSPFVVALVLVAGFFNRPTFVFFAIVPCLRWLLHSGWDVVAIKRDIFPKLLLTFPSGLAITTAFLIGDSMYYGTLKSVTLGMFNVDSLSASLATVAQSLVVTPLNFVRYNVVSSNLAEHGIHPRITHLLVNMPLLFGVLAVMPAVSVMCAVLRRFGCRRCGNQSGESGACKALLLGIAVPLVLISLFPHQEARFLVPFLAPLSLLYGHLIFGSASIKAVTVMWVLFNVAMCEFFGALHQGGVLPCLGHIQNIHTREPLVTRHVIFYHTYMPPRFLLALPSQHAQGKSGESPRCGSTTVHDLKGASMVILNDKVKEITSRNKCKSNEILLVTPATLDHQLCSSTMSYKSQLLQQFHLHLSTENLPSIEDFWCGDRPPRQCSFPLDCNGTNLAQRLYSLTSLNLYQIDLP